MMALLAYVQPDIADSSTLVFGNLYDTDGVHHPSELGGSGGSPHPINVLLVRSGSVASYLVYANVLTFR